MESMFYLWALVPLRTCLMGLPNPMAKESRREYGSVSPPGLLMLGLWKPSWPVASVEARGESWSHLLTAPLTHQGWGLVGKRLEDHCKGLLLVVLAGGQEPFPAFLKEGAEACGT